MKKRILSLLLAVITILQMFPVFALPTIAEDEVVGIDIADMEVGKLYLAEFIYEYEEFVPQKPSDTAGEEDLLEWKGYDEGVSWDDAYVPMTDFPADLIVKRISETDIYFVYVTNEDWPAEYDEYRYVDIGDIIITGEYVAPPADDGLVYGQVGLVMDGESVETLAIAKGEKTYVFTELGSVIQGTPTYRWQLLIDRENNRWANIQDYVYPYAPISEALLVNAGLEDGTATLRCIATRDGVSYASGELDVTVDPTLPAPELPLIPEPETEAETETAADPESRNTDSLAVPAGSMVRSARAAGDAFQVVVDYVYWNNSSLAKDLHGTNAAEIFTVTLLPGVAYNGVRNHPTIPGYKAYVRDDTATGDKREYTALEKPNDPNSEETHFYVEATPIVFSEEKEGREITIYYLPVQVSITVNHYFQNLENDEYSLYDTVHLDGLADYPLSDPSVFDTWTDPDDLYLTAEGFTGLYYDKGMRISANGDTIVEIYYDRNYYLVNFDLTVPDGSKGYGVMPLYVRYGTQLLLGTPTAPGYTFNGWTMTSVYTSTEEIDTDGSIKVNKEEVDDESIRGRYANGAAMLTIKHNLEYKANWTVATTSYTVIYWLENANDTNFTLNSFKVIENAIPGSVINGSDAAALDLDGDEEDHFVFLDSMSDSQVVVNGDGTTAVNVYYARKYYSINFTSTGRCALYVENGNTNYSHTHGTDCDRELLCTKELHTHTDECGEKKLTCTVIEHSHSSSCCTINADGHVHSTACYDYGENRVGATYTGNRVNNANPTGDGYVYRYRSNWTTAYYIYINNSWYVYNSTVNNSQVINPDDSCPTNHSHNSGECICAVPLHTHTDNECYKYALCTKLSHTHSDGCYGQCKKYEHTCGTNCSNANRTNSVKVVTQKYDSDISKIWPIVDANGTSHTGYVWESSITGDYYSILYKMPGNNVTMERYQFSGSTQLHWYYALERLTPTTEYEGDHYVTNGGKYYYVSSEAYLTATNGTNLTYDEDYFPITGFTQLQTKNQFQGGNWTNNGGVREMYLYYTRNQHNLIFHDGEREIKSVAYLYEASLADAFFEPTDIPASKELGSVKFVGWYTTPTCADGTKFDFENEIMPDYSVTLYAKWEPTYWDVTVYQEDPDEHADAKKLAEHLDIPFGTILSSAREPKRTPPMTGYIFAGWYYKEGTEEKRFDFNTMPVKKDYVIYAKWTSEIPVPYIVYYRTTTAGGEVIDIADPTEGVALAGKPRFFTAKVEKDLYDGYQVGYFPELREQTIKIEPVESDPGEKKPFEIVFMYHHDTAVPFQITHVFVSDKFTNTFIGTNTLTVTWTGTANNTDSALLTVNFRDLVDPNLIKQQMGWSDAEIGTAWDIIKDLSPDAYTQRLILEQTDDPKDNEVVFHWSGRYDMVVYEVHHLYENLTYTSDLDKYETRTIQSFDAQFDKEHPGTASYEASVVKGFQFKEVKTNNGDNSLQLMQPTATTPGLIIKVYYERETYEYTLMYFDDATNMPIKDSTTGSGRFEEQIKIGDKAPAITGYNLSNGDEVVELRNGGQAIICYYTRRSAKYVYHQIGEGGSLYRYEEDILFNASDEDMDKTGSYAILADGYILEKWEYKNSEGFLVEVPEDLATVQNGVLKPQRVEEKDVGQTYEFYATIVPNTLTIQGFFPATFNPHPYLQNQGFIYHINGKEDTDTAGYSITVALPVGESKSILGLPAGEYTITIESTWSWRYSGTNIGCTVTENDDSGIWDAGAQKLTFEFDGLAIVEFNFTPPDSDPNKPGGEYFITDEVHN